MFKKAVLMVGLVGICWAATAADRAPGSTRLTRSSTVGRSRSASPTAQVELRTRLLRDRAAGDGDGVRPGQVAVIVGGDGGAGGGPAVTGGLNPGDAVVGHAPGVRARVGRAIGRIVGHPMFFPMAVLTAGAIGGGCIGYGIGYDIAPCPPRDDRIHRLNQCTGLDNYCRAQIIYCLTGHYPYPTDDAH